MRVRCKDLSILDIPQADEFVQVHYWQHGEIGQFKVRKPLILGHESAGIVWQCGAAVRSLKPGDAVALEPGIPCRTCCFCKKGKYNLCLDVEFAATPPHDGTLQTYYAVPEDFCYKLPKDVTIEEGALLEPLSVAVHCVKLAGIMPGSSVLVLGAGPIGLLCCVTARAFGASSAMVVDIVPSRLEFARTYAATATYQMDSVSPQENAAFILLGSGLPYGFDVVIDATGAQACISTGIHAMKSGGKFIQAGLGQAEILFPVAQLCAKEGAFIGSFRYGADDYATALDLVEQKKVNLRDLITHTFKFDEAGQAFTNVVLKRGIKSIIYGPE